MSLDFMVDQVLQAPERPSGSIGSVIIRGVDELAFSSTEYSAYQRLSR